MNCGEDGCPCCPEESPAVAALRRRLGAVAADWRTVQQGLGVAGYVPKEDEDDS